MYKIFYSAVMIFWILDILNFSFMQMFDTTYPINELALFLILLFCRGCIDYETVFI
jgi:hypothetical protein